MSLCPHSFMVPGEVGHLHHDHAHLLGQHDDVIAVVIPLGHLGVQLALLLAEALDLLGDLCLLLLGQLGHNSLGEVGRSGKVWGGLRGKGRGLREGI